MIRKQGAGGTEDLVGPDESRFRNDHAYCAAEAELLVRESLATAHFESGKSPKCAIVETRQTIALLIVAHCWLLCWCLIELRKVS